MLKDMKPSENSEFTVVKNEFPNGWSETPFELLFKRLDENGFKIANTVELYADEMVMDARPHSDLYTIEKEFNVKSYLYGEMRETPESGFILMSMNKHFPDMVEDDFCSRMEVETDDPKVKFHYYSFTEEQEPHSEIDMAICRKYKLNRDKMLGLYVRNYNVMGDWAFIEMPNWKIIPGSAYSKM